MSAQHRTFTLIAGPCVVESFDLLHEVCETLNPIAKECKFDFVFKSSFRKANRTSIKGFSGIGDAIALEHIKRVAQANNVRSITDIHESHEAPIAAEYVDILQIPAFLCRQTELLQAAGATGKIVNIKKGQFLAPDDIGKQAEKAANAGADEVWLTERGTTFGYHDLVVDFRSLLIMKETGHPIIYDATHSLQLPGGGEQSGGLRSFIKPLARAAISVGIDGIFIETHPNPEKALSDSATQFPLAQMKDFLHELAELRHVINSFE
ncbi:MAG: 3-deoxy-8-phosphooctulonate synthase [Candidatus Kapaibacteriota bacterium]|jgi:2-dehydro-3-deoxyphosphooctonate aldolase (KDO 8-P synthase)